MMTSTVLDMASMRLISGQMLVWEARRSLLPLTPRRAGTNSASAARSATGLGRGGRGGREVGRAGGATFSGVSRTGDSSTTGSSSDACRTPSSTGLVSDTAAWPFSGLFCWRFLRRPSCAWRDATRRAFPGIGYLLKRDGSGIGGRPNGHTVQPVDRLTIAVIGGKRQRAGLPYYLKNAAVVHLGHRRVFLLT